MWIFYALSLIPLIIGLILWINDKNITFWEWVLGFGAALLLSITFHICSLCLIGKDVEVWSGQIDHATYYPRWVEQYQEEHTETVGSGKHKHTKVYYTTEYRTHHEFWEATTTIPDIHEISQEFYQDIVNKFNNCTTEASYKDGFYSGDKNIYVAQDKTGYIYPVTATKYWENKVRACPSLFSFPPVPSSAKVFDYPKCDNWQVSDRLLGTANNFININEFDKMNARLGPHKKVNVIMIGFPIGTPSIYGQYQQAKYYGGEKNDVVLVFSGSPAHAEWVYVFGWTESELAKVDLQTILLHNSIDNNILPLIEDEILKNYKIKQWTKFDYISPEPPTWAYWVFGVVLILSQAGYWMWAQYNDFDKEF